MVKASENEGQPLHNLDGIKIAKLVGRVVLPICQVVFVIIYAAIAIAKWNNY
jgi:hypothetical protein